jgi:hypothetical protein
LPEKFSIVRFLGGGVRFPDGAYVRASLSWWYCNEIGVVAKRKKSKYFEQMVAKITQLVFGIFLNADGR